MSVILFLCVVSTVSNLHGMFHVSRPCGFCCTGWWFLLWQRKKKKKKEKKNQNNNNWVPTALLLGPLKKENIRAMTTEFPQPCCFNPLIEFKHFLLGFLKKQNITAIE